MAGFDLLTDNMEISITQVLDWVFMQIDELTDLIIAITGFLFTWLNIRMIKKEKH